MKFTANRTDYQKRRNSHIRKEIRTREEAEKVEVSNQRKQFIRVFPFGPSNRLTNRRGGKKKGNQLVVLNFPIYHICMGSPNVMLQATDIPYS
jgi:hypothetical protein